MIASAEGWLPLHFAAESGSAEAVRLLLAAAPGVAATKAGDILPLEIALDQAVDSETDHDRARHLEAARLLLPATRLEAALAALEEAGEVALPLFAVLAACAALSPAQWQRLPAPCPGLASILPTVLARSTAEAALLVGRLPAKVRQRLRAGALCLGRAQRERRAELPGAIVGQVLALAAWP